MTRRMLSIIGMAVIFALSQFGMELAAGHVPIPAQYSYLVSVLMAVITGVTPELWALVGKSPPDPTP